MDDLWYDAWTDTEEGGNPRPVVYLPDNGRVEVDDETAPGSLRFYEPDDAPDQEETEDG
jgi:hypothetical protein